MNDEARTVREGALPLSSQDKSIIELHETISMLTDRLEPILTPNELEKAKPEEINAVGPSVSPIAATIGSHNESIRRARTRLANLMDRLEC